MALTKEEIKEYKSEEKEAEICCDFYYIANSILENGGDKEWAINLYKKAETKAEIFRDFIDLAESLCEKLGDKEWARSLYKKAEEKAVGDERYHLAQSKSDYLGESDAEESDIPELNLEELFKNLPDDKSGDNWRRDCSFARFFFRLGDRVNQSD